MGLTFHNKVVRDKQSCILGLVVINTTAKRSNLKKKTHSHCIVIVNDLHGWLGDMQEEAREGLGPQSLWKPWIKHEPLTDSNFNVSG